MLGEPAGETRYRDSKGRDKVVHYWMMEPPPTDADAFVPNHEVDELRWCTVAEAADAPELRARPGAAAEARRCDA